VGVTGLVTGLAAGFEGVAGGLTTVGLPVILSIINFAPAPSAAPVSAFTTLLLVEFVLVVVGLIAGLSAGVGVVMLVVGLFVVMAGLVVLVVMLGLVVAPVVEVKVCFGAPVVGAVIAGLVVVFVGVVIAGLEPVGVVIGRLDVS